MVIFLPLVRQENNSNVFNRSVNPSGLILVEEGLTQSNLHEMSSNAQVVRQLM